MRLFSLCRFARFETRILSLPSIRFDINLQNFKKPLDIFSHEEPQAVILLHGIWRHIKEFGIEGKFLEYLRQLS